MKDSGCHPGRDSPSVIRESAKMGRQGLRGWCGSSKRHTVASVAASSSSHMPGLPLARRGWPRRALRVRPQCVHDAEAQEWCPQHGWRGAAHGIARGVRTAQGGDHIDGPGVLGRAASRDAAQTPRNSTQSWFGQTQVCRRERRVSGRVPGWGHTGAGGGPVSAGSRGPLHLL